MLHLLLTMRLLIGIGLLIVIGLTTAVLSEWALRYCALDSLNGCNITNLNHNSLFMHEVLHWIWMSSISKGNEFQFSFGFGGAIWAMVCLFTQAGLA